MRAAEEEVGEFLAGEIDGLLADSGFTRTEVRFEVDFFAVAPVAVPEAGWTDYVLVTELTPTVHQRYEVLFHDYSSRGSGQMYLVVLESVGSGKKVRVFVTGVSGVSGNSQISAVSIRSLA